ncbi:protein SON isoform X2 [Anoplophora glabripennis]|uniref:protein SON isoform X2 n=1 Tax=Anoplophora glabripennis TaxID=217634 RepID=UPI0008736F16|nr:protein SON isoform X2 [Anoplophora glabripennis]
MSSENGEQKPTIPAKSSMEILSELFSTFHAEPPLIIKKEKPEESNRKHKKSKKKHKHKDKKHKKKEKKKKKSSSSSSEDSEVDLAKILIKQEKDASEKKIKIEGTELAFDVKLKNLKKEQDVEDESEDSNDAEVNVRARKNKVAIKSLKLNTIFQSAIKEIQDKVKRKVDEEGEVSDSESSISDKEVKVIKEDIHYKYSGKKRSRSSSKDKSDKKVKIDDLRNKIRNDYKYKEKNREINLSKEKDRYKDHSSDKDFYKGSYHSRRSEDHRSRNRDRERTRDRHRDYRSRSRERHKDSYSREIEDYKRNRNRDSSFYKDDGFYKSREKEDRDEKSTVRDRYRGYSERDRRHRSTSRDREGTSKFDKKKLLEIARKNAITMMKSGSLPGALALGPQAQEKVIAAIKSGGKTIEELTDFCKTLSKKEELGELSSLSEKEESDSETDKPFHHPFQIKDRPTSITMNIKNSVPLPLKSSVERTSELRMQFPVSSGQQHRKGEEWQPVSPPSQKKVEEKEKTIAPAVTTTTTVTTTTAAISIPLPLEAPPLPPELPDISTFDTPEPITVPPPPNAPPGPQAFPTPMLEPAVDIGSIVSQRLTAMRRFQENPNDVQALTQMYKSNKEMQSWATSKQQLGQFTGSTGAQILTQAQLASGYQAWAKKAIIISRCTSRNRGDPLKALIGSTSNCSSSVWRNGYAPFTKDGMETWGRIR